MIPRLISHGDVGNSLRESKKVSFRILKSFFDHLLPSINIKTHSVWNFAFFSTKKLVPKAASGKGRVKSFDNKRWMVSHTVMVRCALKYPYLAQYFQYPECHHVTYRKNFGVIWSQKVRQKLSKTEKFWGSQLVLKNKIIHLGFSPHIM